MQVAISMLGIARTEYSMPSSTGSVSRKEWIVWALARPTAIEGFALGTERNGLSYALARMAEFRPP